MSEKLSILFITEMFFVNNTRHQYYNELIDYQILVGKKPQWWPRNISAAHICAMEFFFQTQLFLLNP